MDLTQPTPPPEPPAKLTEKQIGQLRRQFLTHVNGTVTACGHKDNFSKTEKRKGKPPNNNCISCWEAYFMTSVDLDFIHAVLTQKGANALMAIHGKKFVRMFHGFLSTKLMPILAAEIKKEKTESMTLAEEPCPDCGSGQHRSCTPAKIVGGTFGNGNESSEVPATGSAQQTIG
jgi:hypothetical protein